MSKKAVSLLLALIMAVSLFAGCQQTPSSSVITPTSTPDVNASSTAAQTPKKDYTLKVWVFQTISSDMDQVMIEKIQQFSMDQGVNVVVESVPETTFTTKFTAAVEAGSLPDLIPCRNDHIYITYPNVPFLPMTDVIPELEKAISREFNEVFLKSNEADGVIYAVPFMISSAGGIYRKELFEKAGYDSCPVEWSEIVEAAKKVSDPKNGIYGLGIGCGPTDNDAETLIRSWIWGEGGRLFDENGNPDPVNPPTIRVIQEYVDLYKAGVVPPAANTWDAAGNNKSYLLGESAYIVNIYSVFSALKGAGYEELNKNTGTASYPTGPQGSYSICAPSSFAISKNTKHLEDTKALLAYLYETDWYNNFLSYAFPVYVPVFTDARELDYMNNELGEKLAEVYDRKLAWFGYPCDTVEGKKAGALVFNNYLLSKAVSRIITENLTVEEGLELLRQDMVNLLKG